MRDDAEMRWQVIVAFMLAVAVGGSSLVHGMGFMAGFNTTPLPALSALGERAGPSERSLAVGSVYLVVVDGMRADAVDTLALEPHGMALAACHLEGVLPSFSRPGYVALSTGVPPWASGAQTNDHNGPAALPSIWSIARAMTVRTRLVTDGTDWWTDLFPGAFETVTIVAKRDFDARWDALELPSHTERDLMLVHIVAADDAAHDFGTGAEYEAEIARAGMKINRIIKHMQPSDTLFVTADHGHIARGGHGGPEPEVMAIPFIAIGAGVVANPTGDRHAWCGAIVDVAPTIAARLGITPPVASLGGLVPIVVPVDQRFEHDFSRRLAAQSVAAHDALGAAGIDPLRHGRERAASVRTMLVAAAAWLALVLLFGSLVVGSRRRVLVSALTPSALFALVYVVMEPTLSFSAVWLEGPWTMRLAAMAGGSALVASVFVFARHTPSDALILLTLGAALPCLLALAAHGSASAGPTLGEPHAAFALIVADLFAGVTLGVAVLVAVAAFVRERRQGRAKVWV